MVNPDTRFRFQSLLNQCFDYFKAPRRGRKKPRTVWLVVWLGPQTVAAKDVVICSAYKTNRKNLAKIRHQ